MPTAVTRAQKAQVVRVLAGYRPDQVVHQPSAKDVNPSAMGRGAIVRATACSNSAARAALNHLREEELVHLVASQDSAETAAGGDAHFTLNLARVDDILPYLQPLNS